LYTKKYRNVAKHNKMMKPIVRPNIIPVLFVLGISLGLALEHGWPTKESTDIVGTVDREHGKMPES
jgi:hypothetical protein